MRLSARNDYVRLDADTEQALSPLRHAGRLKCPTIVGAADGDTDEFRRQARDFTAEVVRAGGSARHVEGRAILYADRRTDSMNEAISETNRRRAKQVDYNKENNITPQSILKGVDMELAHIVDADYVTVPLDTVGIDTAAANVRTEAQLAELLKQLETQMREAAKKFEFEKAAQLRDRIKSLKQQDLSGMFGKEEGAAAAT